MKVLMARCDELETKMREPASRTYKTPFIEHGKIGESYNAGNCIVVFACVERKDEKDKSIPRQMSSKINEVLGEIDTKIVMIPFVHLTSTPATPQLAYMYFKELASRLEKKYPVEAMQFGWHRSLYMDIITGEKGFEYISF